VKTGSILKIVDIMCTLINFMSINLSECKNIVQVLRLVGMIYVTEQRFFSGITFVSMNKKKVKKGEPDV